MTGFSILDRIQKKMESNSEKNGIDSVDKKPIHDYDPQERSRRL